jgi:hypothetical protein
MYACFRETGRGFFDGVCRVEDRPPTSRDPPLRLTLRELTLGGVHLARECTLRAVW